MILLLRRGGQSASENALHLLQQQLASSLGQQDERIGRIGDQLTTAIQNLTSNLNERLTQNQMLAQETQKSLAQRLESAGKTIADLKEQLGQLSQATQQIHQVGMQVKDLQAILQSPKLRGGLGEWSLENLLAEVLPAQQYQMQYRFKSGNIVDALVFLAQGRVSIDAKFPLNNFQVMLQASDDAGRQKARRAFLKDVRQRIDEIAQKYIVPEEGTLDFALMYVPAENVYYEAITNETDGDLDISTYSRRLKVIPVSPNTLYAYLMAIALGLKGLQIEKNAQIIHQQLNQIADDLQLFTSDFALIGRHLNNALSKHNEAGKRLDHLGLRFQQLDRETVQKNEQNLRPPQS